MTAPVCWSCGYDLTGLDAEAICPECGREIWSVADTEGDDLAELISVIRLVEKYFPDQAWPPRGLFSPATAVRAAQPIIHDDGGWEFAMPLAAKPTLSYAVFGSARLLGLLIAGAGLVALTLAMFGMYWTGFTLMFVTGASVAVIGVGAITSFWSWARLRRMNTRALVSARWSPNQRRVFFAWHGLGIRMLSCEEQHVRIRRVGSLTMNTIIYVENQPALRIATHSSSEARYAYANSLPKTVRRFLEGRADQEGQVVCG